MVANDWGISKFPFIPGHEVVGVVTAMGSQVGLVPSLALFRLEVTCGYGFYCLEPFAWAEVEPAIWWAQR